MRRLSTLAALLSAAAATPALALPHDFRFELEEGKESFGRLYEAREAVPLPTGIVEAEVLTSEEVRLHALAPGDATVFVTGSSFLSAWRVVVRPKGQPAPPAIVADPTHLAAARAACPDLRLGSEDGARTLEVTVHSEPCRNALLTLVSGGAWPARDLRLTFTPEVLQLQLRLMDRALAAAKLSAIRLTYAGATLVLEGTVTAAERQLAYQELWRVSLGRIALDDQLELREPPPVPEAGAAPAVMTIEEARKAGLLDDEAPDGGAAAPAAAGPRTAPPKPAKPSKPAKPAPKQEEPR